MQSIFSGLVGSDRRRVRGDRHGDLPARRVAPASSTCPTDAPMVPLGATLFGQLSLAAVRGVAVVGVRGAAPRAEDRDERGRHRLGRDAARPAREHRRPLGLRLVLRAATCARPRCCTATSGSAPSTTRRRSRRCATVGVDHVMFETDYPHGDGTWPDSPGRVRRRVRRAPRRTRSRRSATRTRPRSSASRSPRPTPPTPSASARDPPAAATQGPDASWRGRPRVTGAVRARSARRRSFGRPDARRMTIRSASDA